jgi:hypothetical protein
LRRKRRLGLPRVLCGFAERGAFHDWRSSLQSRRRSSESDRLTLACFRALLPEPPSVSFRQTFLSGRLWPKLEDVAQDADIGLDTSRISQIVGRTPKRTRSGRPDAAANVSTSSRTGTARPEPILNGPSQSDVSAHKKAPATSSTCRKSRACRPSVVSTTSPQTRARATSETKRPGGRRARTAKRSRPDAGGASVARWPSATPARQAREDRRRDGQISQASRQAVSGSRLRHRWRHLLRGARSPYVR